MTGIAAGTNASFQESPCGELAYLEGIEDLQRALGRSLNAPRTLLASVIEREIIPRLFLTHRGPFESPTRQKTPVDVIPMGDREAFARLVLNGETGQILDQVQALIDLGVKLERIYIEVLAPVARTLGIWWEEDRCTFTDVTIGLSRLQQVLRQISRHAGMGSGRSTVRRRVYLAPSPGEQHTLGLSMVEEFFLHAGWETASDHAASLSTILQTVSTQHIDVLGLTIASAGFFGPLGEVIAQVRKAASNREMVIMVGGRLFIDHPDVATKISHAAVISDGIDAVDMAEKLLSEASGSPPI
jgi:methanogenic corrinoid protein MtbC1